MKTPFLTFKGTPSSLMWSDSPSCGRYRRLKFLPSTAHSLLGETICGNQFMAEALKPYKEGLAQGLFSNNQQLLTTFRFDLRRKNQTHSFHSTTPSIMQLSLITIFAIISAAFAAPVSFSGSLPTPSLPAGSGFPAPPDASGAPKSLPPHHHFGHPRPSGSFSFPAPSGTFSFPHPSGTPPARPSGSPPFGAHPSGAPPSGAPPSLSAVPTSA